MRAALLVEQGTIVVSEVADPEPGPGDVRIAVHGVGLCGSDLSVFSGRWRAPRYPWIMGHEAFGTIESVGAGVPERRIGESVIVEPNVACNTCDSCHRGWTSACVARRSVGMNIAGALADFLVIPDRFAWAVPDLPAEDLVCAEPLTVVRTALRRLGADPVETSLVVGVGGQGLMMALALLDRSPHVYAADVNPNRVAFAVELGARQAASDPDRQYDLVVDTVGSPGSMEHSIERVEVGGTLLCLGLDSRPFELTAQTLVRRQMTLRGSLTYDHPSDFESTVALIGERRFSPGRVVTDHYPLEEAQIAFERSGSARGKTWVRVAGG